ncbi:MAG: glycosyl transferase [Desulfovibrio sp. S3730MH75]|nr:MAG: glycosyl transferase [Desulfovibrio sp. S3730MH75]
MKLSIVATLYKSENYIDSFVQRASSAARELVGDDFEIILIDDGSPDNSLEVAINLTKGNPNLRVVELSRNFGHHKAMMSGLEHANGDLIFLIDSDLEEQPEWLISFARDMDEKNCDVVYGVQEKRKGGLFERWSGKLFYLLFQNSSGVKIPSNMTVARLMSRDYVQALLLHEEKELFFAGILALTGFKQEPHQVTKLSTSPTTYSLRLKLSQVINAITSYTNSPLYFIFYTGITITSFSFLWVLLLFVRWIFFHDIPSGWTSVIISIWVLGGISITFSGIIGIYLAKIFSETKRRPNSIVRCEYGLKETVYTSNHSTSNKGQISEQ